MATSGCFGLCLDHQKRERERVCSSSYESICEEGERERERERSFGQNEAIYYVQQQYIYSVEEEEEDVAELVVHLR